MNYVYEKELQPSSFQKLRHAADNVGSAIQLLHLPVISTVPDFSPLAKTLSSNLGAES